MKTFSYESRGIRYNNCFFDIGAYKNGDLSLSIYGNVGKDKNVSHISNPTVNVTEDLAEDEVVIDNNLNTNLISFLLDKGIVLSIPRRVLVNYEALPVVKLNLNTLYEYSYIEEVLKNAS